MNNAAESSEDLVMYYRALSDPNRLRIVGLLATRGHSVEELAALLDLKPSTISHHLATLSAAGLVSARTESYYSVYRLEQKALELQARRLLTPDDFGDVVIDIDLDAYDRKVVADYSRRDGSLKIIPAQRRKLHALLRHMVKVFVPGKRYSEKQVNKLLLPFHKDTASLRRELVAFGLMQREGGGGAYWRTEEEEG